MGKAYQAVYCTGCKRPVPDNRDPCPACGSTNRIFAVAIQETIVLQPRLDFKHKGAEGELKAKGRSKTDASRRTGRPVQIMDVVDYVKRIWKQQVREKTRGRKWEDIHTEEVPLDLKPDASWLMDEVTRISRALGYLVHRRYLTHDPARGEFAIRLGRSRNSHRLLVAVVKAAIAGDAAAKQQVSHVIDAALRDPRARLI